MPLSDADAFFRHHFDGSAALMRYCGELAGEAAATAAEQLLATWMNDGKLLVCGSGAAAALAHTLCGYLNGSLDRERMALPVLCLNSHPVLLPSSQTYDPLARQIHALGKPHDRVLLLAAVGADAELLPALTAAHEHGLPVLAITGGDGGALAAALATDDMLLNIPHTHPLWVLETQTALLHALCGYIDQLLLGEADH